MAVPAKKEVMDFSPINTGGKEELPRYRRRAFVELGKALETRLAVAVTGLRRVGKSTIVKQLLERRNAFYFSFDEKKYANADALKRVVEFFLEEADKPLIALDEIFRVEDWAGALKRFHDQKKAQFILTGSSSLTVKKGRESFGGRMLEFYLPPLQFGEYLELKGETPERISFDKVFKARKRWRDHLSDFFWRGSFPEIVDFDRETAAAYIRGSTVEKIVFDDIPSIFRIENPSKLYDLLRLCATNSGALFTESNFAEALQMSRHAVSDYLLHLNKAFLADVVYPTGSFQKALKKQKKVFVKTASIYNAVAENPSDGQAAETAAYDKLSRCKTEFYRDALQREVDFVCGQAPLEVKYQSTITGDDVRNLVYYLEKRGLKNGIVVTKDFFDERKIGDKNISCVPLDVFLLTDFPQTRRSRG
ncbi:MAG: ATP-binding protein [Candidatus Micrarchaeota archaeon]